MSNILKNAPRVPVVLAPLLLWVSFAWGLRGEVPANEGGADVAPKTPAEPGKLTGWFYAGLGVGAPFLGGNTGLNVKYGRYQVTLCAAIQTWNDSHTDIGVLFGYCPLPKLTIAAGVARVRIGTFHPYPYNPFFPYGVSGDMEYSYTVGIPVEVQYTPIKGRVVGLGIVGHGNFNKERIFGGATVGIELGKLK